jgi:hypothetical protein
MELTEKDVASDNQNPKSGGVDPITLSMDDRIDIGKVLYNECCEHIRYMLEWRHKLLLRFFVAVASLLVIVKWMWETGNTSIHQFVFVPLFLAGLSALLFFVMDRRNMKVVKVCRETGAEIELEVFRSTGLFQNLGNRIDATRNLFSYTGMLFAIYCGTSGILLIASLLAFIKFKGWTLWQVIAN